MARAPGDIESFSTGENVYARGGPADRVHRGSLWFEELVWELRVSPVALACRPGNLKLIDETERDLLLAVEMDHVVTTLKKQQDHAARVAEALNPPAADLLAAHRAGTHHAASRGEADGDAHRRSAGATGQDRGRVIHGAGGLPRQHRVLQFRGCRADRPADHPARAHCYQAVLSPGLPTNLSSATQVVLS